MSRFVPVLIVSVTSMLSAGCLSTSFNDLPTYAGVETKALELDASTASETDPRHTRFRANWFPLVRLQVETSKESLLDGPLAGDTYFWSDSRGPLFFWTTEGQLVHDENGRCYEAWRKRSWLWGLVGTETRDIRIEGGLRNTEQFQLFWGLLDFGGEPVFH